MENYQGQKNSADKKLYSLDQLREISMGNEAFVKRMIQLFSDRLPLLLGQIKDAYQNNDFQTVYSTAHLLKPSIDSMGIISIKSTIRDIETMAKENIPSDLLREHISKIDFILMTVFEQLKEELK